MRTVQLSLLPLLVLGLSAHVHAQADPQEPCCNIVSFQRFDSKDVAIQLVSVKRTGTNDITVTWHILNRSKAASSLTRWRGSPRISSSGTPK
jgi:hypothetical protein